ncbi:NAC domain-containing protein 40-like isoform X2 [Salvia miltiorrhiza]|uniref:NAC domain-containing protein 40-like isoform X2 n=2 Tax=Salvia miltiorrhiza TaxID=226208 RepID=UPI0025ABE5A3|nr:NAC domain-containing protein 40-like isoform X2 [Salvia miltiorrhiza]
MGSCNISDNDRSICSMEISIAEASSMFPGFRFSPTDEELIQYYLKRKLHGSDDGVEVIPEVDICRHEPWDLPGQSVIQSDNEWFFFSPRGRKYPNGSQSKRATVSGYWKATGKERSVKSGSTQIGTKRTLVFHMGRAPKGQRTEWIMHEYTTSEKSQDAMVVCRLRKNREFHLNDSVGEGAVENSAPSVSGLVDGAKTAGSCSKDCSSSHNSHSVEQLDTGSESEEKVTNESSHPEDDCYADIMKDDIIKLDDSSLSENPRPIRQKLPSQGTANRRLRLRRHRMESYGNGREHFGIYELEKQTSAREISIENARDSNLIEKSTRIVFLVAVVLISVLILLLYIRGSSS